MKKPHGRYKYTAHHHLDLAFYQMQRQTTETEGLTIDCPKCNHSFHCDVHSDKAVCPTCQHEFVPEWF